MTILDEPTTEPAVAPATAGTAAPWHKSACILCECNCGIEIRLGSDGRTFERIRGDKDHPASKGYTCEKALRLDHYQNGRGERVLHPLRRRDDAATSITGQLIVADGGHSMGNRTAVFGPHTEW